MVLGLSKWLKEIRLYKTWTLHSTQEFGRNKKLGRCFKKWESHISVLKENKNGRIFSLAWNIVYWLLRGLVLNFCGLENTILSGPKSRWKYDIYWLLKREWEIWYFLRQKVSEKIMFTDYWKVLVLSFSVMGNTVFFEAKNWCKGNIYPVFFSFSWYSRTWEIRFFMQCTILLHLIKSDNFNGNFNDNLYKFTYYMWCILQCRTKTELQNIRSTCEAVPFLISFAVL